MRVCPCRSVRAVGALLQGCGRRLRVSGERAAAYRLGFSRRAVAHCPVAGEHGCVDGNNAAGRLRMELKGSSEC